MMLGLDHIAIIVSLEESLRFYETLGFKEGKRFERSYDTVVFMECSSITLEIFIDPKHPERVTDPEAEVGPGDSFDVKPVIYNDATEEMYVFIQVDMPITADGSLYSFDVNNEWIFVSDNGGTIIYAYAGSEMTALQPGDSTSTLTERMPMDGISNAEYAAIDDINISITGYAIGSEDVSVNPTEAWNQCKLIGNIE